MKFGRIDFQATITQDVSDYLGPINAIGEDEPVFMFRAKDTYFCSVLHHYANCFGAGIDPAMRDSIAEHIRLAEQWQEANGSKTPDMFLSQTETMKTHSVMDNAFALERRHVRDADPKSDKIHLWTKTWELNGMDIPTYVYRMYQMSEPDIAYSCSWEFVGLYTEAPKQLEWVTLTGVVRLPTANNVFEAAMSELAMIQEAVIRG